MPSKKILFFTVLINLVANLIGYILGTYDNFSLKNPNIYWCVMFLLLTGVAAVILENNKNLSASVEQLTEKLSGVMINKDSKIGDYKVTILPQILHDKLSLNKLCILSLTSNSIIDGQNPPNLSMESNYPLYFNMPNCSITEVEHSGRFIYYFKDLSLHNDFKSTCFFEYRISFTAKQLGIYNITFYLEYDKYKSSSTYKLQCVTN